MKLTIVSLKRKSAYEIVWIEAYTMNGSIIVLPDHCPTTYIIVPYNQFLYCLKTGKIETLIPEHYSLLNVERKELMLFLD